MASRAGLTAAMPANACSVSASRVSSGTASGRSISMRRMPSAWRRSANGSLSPVGWRPMPQMPTSVSSLSASATAVLTAPSGSASPAKRGR
ncbi:hypothetical protein D3C81_1594850 [compost metagenome]